MRKQKRYTVRYDPTGTGKTALRGMGLFHAIFGTVFAIIALTEIIPNAGLFGVIFLAAGVFFAVNGTLIALGKNSLMGRSYQIETEEEEPDWQRSDLPKTETHDHILSTALDIKGRLEQLETLKAAGLITEQEYRDKRREILGKL